MEKEKDLIKKMINLVNNGLIPCDALENLILEHDTLICSDPSLSTNLLLRGRASRAGMYNKQATSKFDIRLVRGASPPRKDGYDIWEFIKEEKLRCLSLADLEEFQKRGGQFYKKFFNGITRVHAWKSISYQTNGTAYWYYIPFIESSGYIGWQFIGDIHGAENIPIFYKPKTR